MFPESCSVWLARLLRLVCLAAVLLVAPIGTASASEPDAEAIIVNSDGDVVSHVETRNEAADVFERAALTSRSERLKLEYVYRSHGTVPNPPNDPLFAQQWALGIVGVASAWAHTDGTGVVVAVLDSAVNFSGVDAFCSNVVSPYDAITQTEGFADLNTTAAFGHGTHVAGTIAQCTNNGEGVAGIAPGATLMPVRVLSDVGIGTSSDLARGIDWAVDHGADIINLSLGANCEGTWPTCNDFMVDGAIERASAAGVLLISSSGNDARPYVAYPSAHPDVVSVGATAADDSLWYVDPSTGSNQGSGLDLVAPGVGIIQETTSVDSGGAPFYGYFLGSGTSMAAPHVSGAAALMLAVDPTLTADAIVSILRNTAIDLGNPGFDTATGWGRIAVDAAVTAALPDAVSQDPCGFGPCDAVAWIDAGGVWGLLDRLEQPPSVSTFYFGDPGDLPFMGDWDGDGIATPGLYRQSDGLVYLRNSNTQGIADLEFFFGNPGDEPLVGDFDGDGQDTVSIWRPSEARIYVINELGVDGGGLGAADFSFLFGNPNDVPFVGDFDGDGIDTVGLYRQSTGFVYFRDSLSTGNADLEFFFGNPGDQILAGDWDGDGDDTVGVYRPSTGWLYVNLSNTNGVADWQGYVGTYPWVVTAGRS